MSKDKPPRVTGTQSHGSVSLMRTGWQTTRSPNVLAVYKEVISISNTQIINLEKAIT